MAGQCQPGKIFKEVTLKGGINAGTYKDVGSVKSMEECSGKCCEFAACDLAFMLSSRCYLVGCSEGKNCQIQKAKPSPYHPSVTYIERWNKEGVKHSGMLNLRQHCKLNAIWVQIDQDGWLFLRLEAELKKDFFFASTLV